MNRAYVGRFDQSYGPKAPFVGAYGPNFKGPTSNISLLAEFQHSNTNQRRFLLNACDIMQICTVMHDYLLYFAVRHKYS